jgi:hypothetical protein
MGSIFLASLLAVAGIISLILMPRDLGKEEVAE